MQRAKDVAKFLLLVASVTFLVALTFFALQMREVMVSTANKVDGLIQHTDDTLTQVNTTIVSVRTDAHAAQLQVAPSLGQFSALLGSLNETAHRANATLDKVNAGCAPGPCGTLADVNKTLGTVRGTFGQIEIAANHEDKNLTTLDSQEAALFTSVHQTLDGLQPVEAGAAKTEADVDALVNDPAIRQILTNSQDMTLQGAGILRDGRIYADKFVAPTPWYLRTWNYIFQGGTLAWDFIR